MAASKAACSAGPRQTSNGAPTDSVQKSSQMHQARRSGSGSLHGEIIITVWPISRIASLNVLPHHSRGNDCVACSSIANTSNQKNTGGLPSGRDATKDLSASTRLRNLYVQACERKCVGAPTMCAVAASADHSTHSERVPPGGSDRRSPLAPCT